ncbi:MAG: hypothetical protein K8T20_02460 [Planctomycetes bacterium]|nr:hypothetical protein [Planctomycetota bacterium]
MARRDFQWRDRDGSLRPGRIEIGVPRRDRRPGGDWVCLRRIVGFPDEKVRPTYGIDGVQALLLALAILSTELELAGNIIWLGKKSKRAGLPPSRHFFDSRKASLLRPGNPRRRSTSSGGRAKSG